MKKKRYDVIIVGGGPTGLMLARQLDSSKLSVLLIDKRKSIKSTIPGIYGCFRYTVDRLGLSKYIVAEHDGVQFHGATYKTSFFFKKRPFVTVDMSKWAKELKLRCAKKLNTTVKNIEKDEEGYVLHDTKKKKYYCRLLVDCTGHKQVLSQKLGVGPSNRQYYNAAFELTNCKIPKKRKNDVGLVYDHTNSNMGLWFYMYNEKECQLGLGDIINNTDDITPNIVKRLKNAMNHPIFEDWFKHAKIKKTTVGIGPTLRLHSALAKDHFVSIGDAGATNAALLAVQIIARHDETLAAAYRDFKMQQAQKVEARNRAIQEQLGS